MLCVPYVMHIKAIEKDGNESRNEMFYDSVLSQKLWDQQKRREMKWNGGLGELTSGATQLYT